MYSQIQEMYLDCVLHLPFQANASGEFFVHNVVEVATRSVFLVIFENAYHPTPGCENQCIWAVVSKGVDTTGPNWHIGYNTLICISVLL